VHNLLLIPPKFLAREWKWSTAHSPGSALLGDAGRRTVCTSQLSPFSQGRHKPRKANYQSDFPLSIPLHAEAFQKPVNWKRAKPAAVDHSAVARNS